MHEMPKGGYGLFRTLYRPGHTEAVNNLFFLLTFFRLLLLALIMIPAGALRAQKNISRQHLIWEGVFIKLEVNDKWYWQNEIQERHFVSPMAHHQFLFRSHLHRYIANTGWDASVGMSLFLQNPNDPEAPVKLTVPELRPHIEVAYSQKLTKLKFDHRFRTEARFFHNTNHTRTELEDGFGFGNFRFRYRLQATIPLWRVFTDHDLRLKLSDELHVNMGKKILTNIFDQNRIYVALNYELTPNVNVEAGYLNWFQQTPDGQFYNRDILNLTCQFRIRVGETK